MTENSELWSSMLATAGGGTVLPKGTLLILGNTDVQNCIIQRISHDSRELRVANAFGLGYAFIDYKDEHDDRFSQLDIYSLGSISREVMESHLAYLSMVASKIKENEKFLVAIALDWEGDVVKWLRTLRLWIDLLQMFSRDRDLSAETQRLQRQFSIYTPPNAKGSSEIPVEVPLQPGQFDSPLGVDLLVVLVGSESTLKSEISEDTIDYIQQVLRVITLKHGGSFVNMPFSREISFDGLLDVISERLVLPVLAPAAQRTVPSIVEQDKIVIPAGWDTSGKIEAVHEGFDVAKVGSQWDDDPDSLIQAFESTVAPDFDKSSPSREQVKPEPKIDYQTFLSDQYKSLHEKKEESQHITSNNVSGIQVEGMEVVLRRLKARDAAIAAQNPETPDRRADRSESTSPQSATAQNEVLANFFQNLLTRQKQSPASSPDRKD